jgi:hypothetical protein
MPTNVAGDPSIGGGASLDIANSVERVAIVFMAAETKSIDGLFFKIRSVAAGTSCNMDVRIEEVSTTTGQPNGILISSTAGRESSASVTITAAGDYYVTFPIDEFDGPFVLTQGTLCAIVFVPTSVGTGYDIHFATFSDDNVAYGLPYCLDYDGQTIGTQTAHYRDNVAPIVGLALTGSGYPIKNLWPITAVGMDTFQATSTPDTIGNRLSIDAPARISGVRVWVDADSTGTVKLYGTNGSTVLASANIYAAVPPTPGGAAHIAEYYFSASVDLAVGTYYLAVEATGGTIGIATMTFQSSPISLRGSSPLGGATMAFATCTQTPSSTASWTVNLNKQAFIAPIFSGSEIGGGAGTGGETSHVFAA